MSMFDGCGSRCVQQHAADHALPDTTAYWVCAFALNQHGTDDSELNAGSSENPFVRATQSLPASRPPFGLHCTLTALASGVCQLCQPPNLEGGTLTVLFYAVAGARDCAGGGACAVDH
jgi:hypothetical protein